MHWNVNSITLCCWYCRCSSLQSLKLACKLCDVNLVKNGQAFICFLILPYVLWLGCIHNWNIYSNRKLCVGAFVLRQLLPRRFFDSHSLLFGRWTATMTDNHISNVWFIQFVCLFFHVFAGHHMSQSPVLAVLSIFRRSALLIRSCAWFAWYSSVFILKAKKALF